MRHRGLSLIVGPLLLVACSTAQPILYLNAHMQLVGKEVAEKDIEVCRQLAESAGAEESTGKGGRVATGTVVGGGVGADDQGRRCAEVQPDRGEETAVAVALRLRRGVLYWLSSSSPSYSQYSILLCLPFLTLGLSSASIAVENLTDFHKGWRFSLSWLCRVADGKVRLVSPSF